MIGDKLSQTRTYDGSFNKDILRRKGSGFFDKKDLFLLKYFYRKYQKFGYHKNKYNFKDTLKFKILTFFPLSYELKEVTRYPLKISNYYFIAKRIYKFLKNKIKYRKMVKKSKYYSTIGPSSLDSKMLKYFNKKVDIVRINLSHVTPENCPTISNF